MSLHDRSPVPGTNRPRRWFLFGCLFEGSFGVAAFGIAPLLHVSLTEQFHWRLSDAAWGVAGTGPLLAVFAWTLRTRLRGAAEIRGFLERDARPILGEWSVIELAVISSLAGVGEELLFRGVLQTSLARAFGSAVALFGTSVLFGMAHAVTRGYALAALGMSIYLGLLAHSFSNLLVPIVTHGLYDWIALLYFLRFRR